MSNPHRLLGSGLENGQAFSLMADFQATIQELPNIDTGFGIAPAFGSRGDLQPVTIKGDGVVIRHGTLMFEAEVVFQTILL